MKSSLVKRYEIDVGPPTLDYKEYSRAHVRAPRNPPPTRKDFFRGLFAPPIRIRSRTEQLPGVVGRYQEGL
jgi:hypothetical protein